jgi:hypothetical protein|tara:strand:- start:186 stop:407 length:222 start_codon:yes stop_codon:yes gene_type:complete
MMSKNTPTPTPNEHAQAYQLMAQIGRSTVAVIDAIVQRGGFRGEELSTIGTLRDQSIQAISMSEAFEAKEGTS